MTRDEHVKQVARVQQAERLATTSAERHGTYIKRSAAGWQCTMTPTVPAKVVVEVRP